MGGAVWSYFQTFSTRQSTYAPVVMIGSGLSIMYVMALVFITELIGENKVSVSKQVLMVSKKDLVANSDQFSYSAFPTSHFWNWNDMKVLLNVAKKKSNLITTLSERNKISQAATENLKWNTVRLPEVWEILSYIWSVERLLQVFKANLRG